MPSHTPPRHTPRATICVLALLCALPALAEPLPAADMPLPPANSGQRSAPIDTVMLHFASDVIANPDAPFRIERIFEIFRQFGVSSHYAIARDGTVYRFVDDSRRAFHAGAGTMPLGPPRTGSLNDSSIGIELLAIGSQADMAPFLSPAAYQDLARNHPEHIGYTDAQYEALDRLLDDLDRRHPRFVRNRYHIVGHDEYAPDRKTDPGELFDWDRLGLRPDLPADWAPGDFDLDGDTDAQDLDLLHRGLRLNSPAYQFVTEPTRDDPVARRTFGLPEMIRDILGTELGDTDLDGDVDAQDLAAVRDHLGLTGDTTWAAGDLNADGRVDADDLAIVQQHQGFAAPEPGSASAAAALAALAALRRP